MRLLWLQAREDCNDGAPSTNSPPRDICVQLAESNKAEPCTASLNTVMHMQQEQILVRKLWYGLSGK
jgi:hypothetical protein